MAHASCQYLRPRTLAAFASCSLVRNGGRTVPIEDAWKALPTYQPGQDMAALLAIDRAVIQAMASPPTRSACAARLAALLADAGTTPAARQYICLQLRQIGTPAEVPLLARLLSQPDTSEMARYALETIPGRRRRRGVARRPDGRGGQTAGGRHPAPWPHARTRRPWPRCSAGRFARQAGRRGGAVGLGQHGRRTGGRVLARPPGKAGMPTPQDLAVPLLRCADALAKAGKPPAAQAIYDTLSQAGQAAGLRRAALEGLLRLQRSQATATILAWFADRMRTAGGSPRGTCRTLPDEQLDRLLAQLPELPDASKLARDRAGRRARGKQMLPMVLSLMQSDKPKLKLAGIRCLGMVGDASVIPQLVDLLAAGGEVTAAAQDALLDLPRKEVGAALLEALSNRPEIRVPVIGVLVKLRCYEAIDPLVEMAVAGRPGGVWSGLGRLAGHRRSGQDRYPAAGQVAAADPAGPPSRRSGKDDRDRLRQAAGRRGSLGIGAGQPWRGRTRSEMPKYLPLLGRLGGPQALELIGRRCTARTRLSRKRRSAVCAIGPTLKWPSSCWRSGEPRRRTGPSGVWALRAYVRVVTPEERPAGDADLAHAPEGDEAGRNAGRKTVGPRRGPRRSAPLETVTWVAPYLDDPAVSQAACEAHGRTGAPPVPPPAEHGPLRSDPGESQAGSARTPPSRNGPSVIAWGCDSGNSGRQNHGG